jgi:hypothetical protein
MDRFKDVHGRQARFTGERRDHIESDHPEMSGQLEKIENTLLSPDIIVKSRTDPQVELFYRNYKKTPVSEKYLCVAVKALLENNLFIMTAYFTDTIKGGEVLWGKK